MLPCLDWGAGGREGVFPPRIDLVRTTPADGWDAETPGEGWGQVWGGGAHIQGSIFWASCFCQQLERKDASEAASATNHGGWAPP